MEYSVSNPIWNDFWIVPPLSWPKVQLSRGIWVLNDRWYCWAGQKARLPSHSSRRWPILGSSVSLLSVTRRSSSPLRNFKKKSAQCFNYSGPLAWAQSVYQIRGRWRTPWLKITPDTYFTGCTSSSVGLWPLHHRRTKKIWLKLFSGSSG